MSEPAMREDSAALREALSPWQSHINDPVRQVQSIAFRARNGMGGNRSVRDTEGILVRLYQGKALKNKEIFILSDKFNLAYQLGLFVGGKYNPKYTQEKFESLRSEIQEFIKKIVLDQLTDIPT